MCGIAGVAGKGNALELVRRMARLLEHRGPDGEGYFTAPGIALGHRRLAILDLSHAGHQPMTSRDGRWTIVLNGEIFNYLELKARLIGPFRSSSDTEVLLEACAEWGVERALDASVGMFAFALWDHENRTLTLARDRVGEKPLVYYWDGVILGFASELKALRPLHEAHLDPAALDAYLALGYVPAPLAIFRHTRKLPAGHLMELHAGHLRERRWWFPERATQTNPESRQERRHQLRALVSDAVRLRLRSDVPVALCLSGGVDSSVIAAECAHQGVRLDAYTVALDGDATDLPWAIQVARHLGLRQEVIEARSGDVASQLEKTWACYDEPFADSSALPSLALAHALGGRYKVVLTGDGGDEAFAGYRHYEHIAAKQFVKAAAASAGLSEGHGRLGVYVQSKTTFRLGERARLLNGHSPGDTLSHLLSSDGFLSQASGGALKQALWSDRHLYLANDLTYKTDIALSAYAVEARAPFLDHRLLEWAQQLEDRDLVRGREKKVILREAYRQDLPPGVLDRPKHGFGAPLDAWLNGPLREARRAWLPGPLLDAESQQNLSGQKLWTVLAFARWADHWGGFMVKPVVTVLMPVYNTPPELLTAAIRSIEAQTFTDFELLILDDGSSDPSTLAALKNTRDRRLRVSHQTHRGLTPSLNLGLGLAAGDFVARHDADDWSDCERLERQVLFLRSHPETVVVGSAVWMHQHGGRALWLVEFPLTPLDIDRSFWTRNPFVHGSVMFRKAEALEAGGYREALRCSQDYDFFWRLSQGGRGANLPEALYHYRFTRGSVSAAKAEEQALAHRAARVLAASRQKGEQENVAEALQTAQASRQEDSSFRGSLKQADHLMLAGEYGAAARAYLRLLRGRPASPLAWAKLLRLGVFQTVPLARKACFR